MRSWGFVLFMRVKYCFQFFSHENSYLSIKLFIGCFFFFLSSGEKRISAFWWTDTCVEIANINTATAILDKPCTCTSPPEKRKGALRQNGNKQRSSSLGERSTKQTAAAAASGFQHDQHWQLNTKPNKMRLCNY